ncbi:TRAP transporter small permease [Martelella sp. AD-3]|uniref:TRAP transporter small permease n=2 Tax=Martelella sp. AD-3 TaxID=686597 RepID=UPI0009EE914F|nr:TRAP transporter small permease [Martelella sp. AD-3]
MKGFHVPGTDEEGGGLAAASPMSGLVKKIIAWISAVFLCVMMVLTVIDVVGRYIFNAPLAGATEMTELLLSAVIFIGLPAATLDRDHVTVDFLTDRLNGGIERIRVPAIALLSAAIMAVVAWRLWLMGDQIAGYGGVTVSLHLPVAPLAYLAGILTGLSACIMLAMAGYAARRGS